MLCICKTKTVVVVDLINQICNKAIINHFVYERAVAIVSKTYMARYSWKNNCQKSIWSLWGEAIQLVMGHFFFKGSSVLVVIQFKKVT